MRNCRASLAAISILCAGAAAGCAHGRAPASAASAAAPAPDVMAAQCAKLDAAAAVVANHQQLALLSDDNPARRESEVELGLAYYCLGLYAETLATLDPLAVAPAGTGRQGPELDRAIAEARGDQQPRTAHAPALRLLVALHRRFPRWPGIEDAVAAWAPASYDVPALADVRDELLYLAGRSAYRVGDFTRALDLLGRVSRGSGAHVRARLLEGAVHVRKYNAGPAVAAFQDALRAAEAGGVGPESVRLRDVASISLARTFYSTGQFDLAAKYYARIPPESVCWRDRLFESGWTDYRRGNYAATLADAGALRAAGAVPPELMAEATLLESVAALEAGDQERAASALAAFNAKYPPMFAELKTFLAANPDDGALWARVAALRHGKSDLPPPVDEVVRRLLPDPVIAGRLEDVDELAREVAGEERLSAAWRSGQGEPGFEHVMSADLTARLSDAIKEAGSITRRRIKRVTEELGRQIRRTIHIDYELLRATLVR